MDSEDIQIKRRSKPRRYSEQWSSPHRENLKNIEKQPNTDLSIVYLPKKVQTKLKPLKLKSYIGKIQSIAEQTELAQNEQKKQQKVEKIQIEHHNLYRRKKTSTKRQYFQPEAISEQKNQKNMTQKQTNYQIDQASHNQIFGKYIGNYVEAQDDYNQEVIVKSNKSILRKIIIAIAVVISVATVAAIILGIKYGYHQKVSPKPNPPKIGPKPPINFNTKTNVNSPNTSYVVIQRGYESNQAYVVNYSINTIMSQNFTARINYTCLFAVEQIDIDNNIYFSASISKVSEEDLSQEGQQQGIRLYQDPTIFYNILKYGAQSLNDSSKEQPQGDQTSPSCEQIKQELNITNMTCHKAIIPTFKFSLFPNGKINDITFPMGLEKATIALMKSFVKMFSPLLDTDLYQKQEPRTVTKKLSKNKLLSESQQDINGTQSEQNIYHQSQNYQKEENQDQVSLKNDGKIYSQSDTHQTEQNTQQQSNFSKSGKLQSGSLKSQTLFGSINQNDTESNESETNDSNVIFSPKAINLNQSISSKQECHMIVVQQFTTSEQNVQQFSSLLQKYQQQNQTLKLDVQGLIKFITGQNQNQDIHPGGYRLLLEQDGSLSLIKYDKKVKILGTNVIGFKIGAYGYVKLNLNVYQDRKNPNKKRPKFIFNTGVIIVLGNSNFPISLVDYEKQLPPLTLKYTLSQIEDVMDLVKGGFIQEIMQIGQMIRDGDFDGNFVQQILQTAGTFTQIAGALGQQINKTSPTAILAKIYKIGNSLEQIIQSKGMALLDPNNQIIENLSSNIQGYIGQQFSKAFQQFQKSKNLLQNLKNKGFNFLENVQNNFRSNNASEVANQIQNLIPPQIKQKYSQEIKKAQIIIDTINYLQNNGNSYINNLLYIFKNHEQNLLKLVTKIVNGYFANQTQITNSVLTKNSNNLKQLQQNIQNFQSKLSYLQTINSTIVNHFRQILSINDLGAQAHLDTFSSLMTTITNQANAASSEATQCCRKRRKYFGFVGRYVCVSHNGGYGSQLAVPGNWQGTKQQLQLLFPPVVQGAQKLISEVDNTLNSVAVSQIAINISASFARFQPIPFDVDNITQTINNNINQANSALSNVGCGSTTNIRNYIASLNQLLSFITSYGQLRSAFQSSCKAIINSYRPEIYSQVLAYSKINPAVTNFVNNFHNYTSKVQSSIEELVHITQTYKSDQFVSNSSLIKHIFSLYNNIKQILNQPSQSQAINQQQIQSARSVYSNFYNKLSQQSDSVISNELTQCKTFLKQASSNILDSYEKTNFTGILLDFNSELQKIMPDYHNFTVLLQLWDDFQNLRNKSISQMNLIKEKYKDYKGEFFQMSTADEYRSFLNGISQLVEQFKNSMQNISLDLSDLRQHAGQIKVFQTSNDNEIKQAMNFFQSSVFNLSCFDLFPKIQKIIQESLNVINSLNFDLITAFVAGTNIKDYFDTTLEQFQIGIKTVNQKFINLCYNFINLKSDATQDHLNSINNDLHNLANTLNDTIFPNVTTGMNQISKKFQGYKFHSLELQISFKNSMGVLLSVSHLMDRAKQTIFSKSIFFIDKISGIISVLKIASLNSLKDLGNVITDQYHSFMNNCSQIIKKILNFPQKVHQNFKNIFHFPQFLDQIKNQFIQQVENVNNTVTQQLQKTMNSLKENQKFFEKFKDSPIANSIGSLQTKGLVVDVQKLWNSSDISQKIQQIAQQVKKVSEGVQEYLSELSDAKQQVQNIQKSVRNRVSIIKDQLKIIKKKVFNLQQLIFRVLSADLGDVVMGGVKNISAEVDAIINIDFASIGTISKQDFNVTVISNMVTKVVGLYSKVQSGKNVFIGKMQKVMNKIDDFLKSQVAGKMDKLQQGLLFIKSQTNLDNPVEHSILYQKPLYHKQNPILPFQQVIPTVIGTFNIKLFVNYSLGAEVLIELQKFRNISIGVNFSASLIIDIQFAYGIVHIIQFGIFCRGNLLRADIYPQFLLGNFIPVQLVKQLAQVAQINSQNIVTVDFVVDLEIYALQLDVGFYLSHIWIQLIWKNIHFCVNLVFTKFCISFKLPIGFKFVEKRNDWGKTISGIQLAKKRIIDMRLLKFKV